ncbi:hypothetical protein C0557_27425 [Kosakonia sp. MUSA4]|nr:hypothetical protein C0557_27425 [Kosakonia sp. MUSA4]
MLVYLFFSSMQYFGHTLLQVNAFNKIMLSAYYRRNGSYFLMALNNRTDQHHKNGVRHNKTRAKIRKKRFLLRNYLAFLLIFSYRVVT